MLFRSNDTATTEIYTVSYTLSLHDALPIFGNGWFGGMLPLTAAALVAAKGNIFAGLWYPVIVAAVTVVVGALFIRETREHKIDVL